MSWLSLALVFLAFVAALGVGWIVFSSAEDSESGETERRLDE